jgi:leader peptidase (prepilin peptidase)/N-methyltransferase
MHCGHDLHLPDLVPVLSWVFLRGRCRYCGEKVSVRYPLVEILFALITLACLLKFDLTVLCLRNYVFLIVLYLLTLTDLDTMTIPDSCHVIAIAAWIVTAPVLYSWSEALPYVLAAVVFGGGVLAISLVMDHILQKDSLGGGDIKLIFVIGLYFGFVGTLFVLILSCVLGLVFNLTKKKQFPFGPWLAGAAAIMLFVGEPLISWYTGLMG